MTPNDEKARALEDIREHIALCRRCNCKVNDEHILQIVVAALAVKPPMPDDVREAVEWAERLQTANWNQDNYMRNINTLILAVGKGVWRGDMMLLNLSKKENAYLETVAAKKEMSKTSIMRQALRIYQLYDEGVLVVKNGVLIGIGDIK